MKNIIDVLMITFERPAYTYLAIERLIQTVDDDTRIWLWHNGSDEKTLSIVQQYHKQGKFFKFYHSKENRKLVDPTNWVLLNGDGEYVAKIDDDCLMPENWTKILRKAHIDNPKFGVIGCWVFKEDDFIWSIAKKKIKSYKNGHHLLINAWINGSGFLMKRQCIEQVGPLKEDETFPQYCIRLRWMGWINGWYYPFLYQEHMDDPRSKYCIIKSEGDLQKKKPLTALKNDINSLDDYLSMIKKTALYVQKSRPDPCKFFWVRRSFAAIAKKLLKKIDKCKERTPR